MEKTLARAIYRKMEVGRPYSTRDLADLIGDDYYKYIPEDMQPGQPNGKPVQTVIAGEMWKVVNAGYAGTYKKEDSAACVRGLKFGTKPRGHFTFSVRYWTRTK